MNVIDFFCGCGGLSQGFIKADFNLVAAFDNWEKAISVYNANFAHKAILADVNTINMERIKIKYNPDIIIGGPPCQDYSSAGKQDETLGRAILTLKYAEIITSIKPHWFLMENVDRIKKSETLPLAIKMYKKAGYGLTSIILDASLCGVPQKRKRFFLIGELNGKDNFLLKPLISGVAQRPLTIYEYMHNELNTIYYYRHPRSYERRAIFSIYEPSPTIRGVNRPVPVNYRIHKNDATQNLQEVRCLTTKERSRIQTFPKNFNFEGCSKTDLEQMIGNAVPVELAFYVAKNLKEYIINNFGKKQFE